MCPVRPLSRPGSRRLKMLMKTRLTTWTAGGNDFRWEALMKFNQSSNRLVSFVHDVAYSIPIGPRIFESLNLLQWIMCRKPLHFYTMHVYVYIYIFKGCRPCRRPRKNGHVVIWQLYHISDDGHKDTALPDEETPWPWRTNRVQNMRFPRPERPFWNLLQKACYTFLEAGCWLAASCFTAAVALTAAFACVCCCLLLPAAPCCCLLLVLLLVAAAAVVLLLCCCNQTASTARNSYCCCCCAHKDTALLDGETPWPWRTNGVQNRRFPGPEHPFWNLLEKACYTFLLLGAAAAAGAADPSKRRLPARKPHATEGRQRLLLLLLLCPQRHGPPGRGNTMALKDERSPKYAFPEAGTSLLKSPTKSLLAAAAAGAADPSKRRLPARKPHATEGRRNVPSEISYKKLAISFSRLAAGSLLAAALLPLRLLLRLLVSAAAYWCLLLPAAACGCLLPAAPCCCAHKDTALPDGETPWPWRTNGVQNKIS